MAADAAVSLGVVIAGILILSKGWLWVDPVISLVVAVVILISTWSLLRDSLNYAMDAVPDHINLPAIEQYLENLEGVVQFHDLHIWPLSTTEVALTVHLIIKSGRPDNTFLTDVAQHLHAQYREIPENRIKRADILSSSGKVHLPIFQAIISRADVISASSRSQKPFPFHFTTRQTIAF